MPESFQSLSIRVFCRNHEKDELLYHAFEAWKRNCNVIVTAGPGDCPPPPDQPAIPLSQEEGDFEDGGYYGQYNDEDDDDEEIDFQPNVPRTPERLNRNAPPASVTPKPASRHH